MFESQTFDFIGLYRSTAQPARLVVFNLSIACFNSVFSLVSFLFRYIYQFSIKKLRVRVTLE